jgi:hypothetical protein
MASEGATYFRKEEASKSTMKANTARCSYQSCKTVHINGIGAIVTGLPENYLAGTALYDMGDNLERDAMLASLTSMRLIAD